MTFRKSVLGSVAAVALTVGAAFASVPAQTNACAFSFNDNLRLGKVSTDVKNLQTLLNLDATTKVASTGAGSMGYETLRFGPATFAAVKKFQAANAISPMSGYVGPLTRAALNTICTGNGNQTNTNTNTGSGVYSNNIPVSVLVDDQNSAKLGEFVVSGNGMVSAIELGRIGISNNDTLRNVYLYDGATRLTDAASVLTDGTIRFTSPIGLFAAPKTITVRADIGDGLPTSNSSNVSASGQTVGVILKSITMLGGTATPVNGVNGPLFSIASANLATVTAGATNSAAGGSVNAGATAQNVWGASVTVSTRAVNLKGLSLKMIGSAPISALTNIRLYVDNAQVGSGFLNSNNLVSFDLSTMPAALTTGGHSIEVRADVTGGASRNFKMSLENATDILLEDTSIAGAFVNLTSYSNVKDAAQFTIGSSNLTIALNPAFSTTNVVAGASNATVASFKVSSFGEDTKIQTLNLGVAVSGATNTLRNVTLYVNGAQIGTSQNFTGTTLSWNLGSQFIVMSGAPAILDVKADVVTSGGVNLADTVTIAANVVSTVGQGLQSFDTPSSLAKNGQGVTVGGSSATFSKNGTFDTTINVAPNASDVKIGSFVFQNGNVEDVTVNNLKVDLNLTTLTITDVSNLTLKENNGTQVGNIIGQPTASNNNFSVPSIVVAKNGSKVFDIYASVGSTAGSVYAQPTISYRGNTSYTNGTNLSATYSTVTVGSATLAFPTKDTNSAVAQYVVGGSQSSVVKYKFTAPTSPVVIEEMTFDVSNINRIVSITVGGITKQINATTDNVVNGLAIAIPATGSPIVEVTATYGNVGSSNGNPSNSTPATITLTDIKYKSGTTVQPVISGSVASNGMTVVASKPIVSAGTSPSGATLISSPASVNSVKIGEVTIAADNSGNIELTQLEWALGASSATIVGTEIRDANGTVIAGSSCTAGGVCTLASDSVTVGTPKTYSLYAEVNGLSSTANGSSVSSAPVRGGMIWKDVNGGGTGLDGTPILSFPTGIYSVHN